MNFYEIEDLADRKKAIVKKTLEGISIFSLKKL